MPEHQTRCSPWLCRPPSSHPSSAPSSSILQPTTMRLSAATLLPPMILHSANGIGVSITAFASPRTDYGPLTPLIGGAADLRLVEENWDEVLRLAASLRAGTVPPSV